MDAKSDARPDRCDPDEALIARCRDGDQDAWNEVSLAYQSRLERYAHRLLKNHADAQEIPSEVIEAAIKHIGGFRGDCSFATWLNTIAFTKSMDKLRASRRAQSKTADADVSGAVDSGPDPLAQLVEKEDAKMDMERLRMIEAVLSEFPQEHRANIRMRSTGFTAKQVAQTLRISEAAAQQNHRRWFMRLCREVLRREQETPRHGGAGGAS